jgi:hypothetical protein
MRFVFLLEARNWQFSVLKGKMSNPYFYFIRDLSGQCQEGKVGQIRER